MPVTIIDTITTISEVCLLQGHNMNTVADAGSTRIFSDDMISTVINNVVRFVYGNSRDNLDTDIKLFAINTLSVMALNNLMHEAGCLPDWVPVDPFDKGRFYDIIFNIKDDDDSAVDVIPTYRGQFHEVY